MLKQFIDWENGLMRAPDPVDRVAAARSVYAYLKVFLEQQRKNPGNDFIRAIVEGQVEGRPMTYLETMGCSTCSMSVGWTQCTARWDG